MNEKSGGDFCVKIPIGEEGLKATMELKKRGVKVLMTAIFTPAQALMAAKAGADLPLLLHPGAADEPGRPQPGRHPGGVQPRLR